MHEESSVTSQVKLIWCSMKCTWKNIIPLLFLLTMSLVIETSEKRSLMNGEG